jgi:hypothetical protein
MLGDSEIRTLLGREIKAAHNQLAIAAREHKRRWGGPGVETDDLFQEGALGAFRQLLREMTDDPTKFLALDADGRRNTVVRIASTIMRNKICDDHRRAYRRRAQDAEMVFEGLSDDRLREAVAARENLQAIEGSLSGPTLELFRLIVRGDDDVPSLALAINRSVAQTYRLLHSMRATAHAATGRPSPAVRRPQAA